MALTDLERLRLQIQDRPRVVLRENLGVGDGLTTDFLLQLYPVQRSSEMVRVNNALQDPATDYTLANALGLLSFTTAPASDAALNVTYQWATFSNAELEDLLTQYGTVRRAAIAALEILLADTERFIKYTFGQESVDRTATREGLEKLLARLDHSAPGPVVIVKANTACREALMEPFIEQEVTCA